MIFGGMEMKKFHEFILVFVLGIVVPVIVISAAGSWNTSLPEVVPFSESTAIQIESVDVDVLMGDGSVAAMDLEEYVLCVVLREMPADFETEALKAQAVVARTYTLRHILKAKHTDAHVCTQSSCCQGFWKPEAYLESGGTEEKLFKVCDAVDQTAGQILVYNDEPIEATYFSSSGGMTEDAAAVWGTDVPYLQATTSPGEEKAAHYVDTVRTDITAVAEKLGIRLKRKADFTVGNIRYTEGGGVASVEICGKTYTGTQLRKKLELRSTAFVISVVGESITITTKGYGHRVGMSQYGADAMAVAGSDYKQILLHYYKGVEFSMVDAFC